MIGGGFYFEDLLTMECCVSPFLVFFSENSAPFVIVMSRLIIYFMFDSFKLLMFILFCISLAFSPAFLEEIYSMRTCLYWNTFFGCVDDTFFWVC